MTVAALLYNFRTKVAPFRIFLFDQRDLPGATPFFDFFFTCNCGYWIVIAFEPDETNYVVPRGEAVRRFAFVFVDTADQISCDAQV